MRVLQGKDQITISENEFRILTERFGAADIDVGTGDGRFVLDRAGQHPERLIVGLDPVAGAMEDAANRITRRRTRQDNVLFVVASIEQMPEELSGVFEHIFVNLPWGSLMRGLILGEREIIEPLATLGKAGAEYRITLNLRIFNDPVPLEVRDLPEVTVAYVEQHLVAPYSASGLGIEGVRLLGADDLDGLHTTWARRLSHQRPPPSIEICAVRL